MNNTVKVARYELSDVIRSKWAVAYAIFFAATSELLLRFGGGGPRVILSLGNVVLLVVPLVGLLFTTLHFYNNRRFVEMLLVQPLRRSQIFTGVYAGLLLPLSGSFLVGIAVPFLFRGLLFGNDWKALSLLLLSGCLLTAIFVGLALVFAVRFEDKARGMGASLLAWLALALVYDGIVLFILQAFSQYPLDKPVLAMVLANPVDLARILLMMQLDASALMGYTGAVFERFFGGFAGTAVSVGLLFIWAVIPFWLGRSYFHRKDF